MKKILSLLLVTLVVACNKSAPEPDAIEKTPVESAYSYQSVKDDPSQTRIYTLSNGMKVYLAQNKNKPTIQTFVAVRAGSNNDPADNTGLAHYLEHMLFKGTSKIGTLDWDKEQPYLAQLAELFEQHKQATDPAQRREIYQRIDALSQQASHYAIANEYDKILTSIGGSGINAHTWFDETIYKAAIPSNELERWLQVEQERFSELVLRLFHTELEVVYEEFNRSQDNDSSLAFTEMFKLLFPNSNYGLQTTIGTSEHLKTPSMQAIHKYFEQYYVPSNMALVLVGDLEFEPTIALVEQYFGKLTAKPAPAEYIAQEPALVAAQERTLFTQSQEELLLSYRLDAKTAADNRKALLVNMLLSSSGAGLINLNINQKQLAMSADSEYIKIKDFGIHLFSARPKQGQKLPEVVALLQAEIAKLKAGEFDDWLLTAVINDLRKRELQALESNASLATSMYNAFIQRTDWQDVANSVDELAKISKQDIVEFVKQNYQNNFVVIYKQRGENKNLIHVDNPKITPIELNRDKQSEFYTNFKKQTVADIQPQFIDFDTALTREQLNPTTEIISIANKTNALTKLLYITEIGTDNDAKLALAFDYLNFLGTDKYTAEELNKEFYKIGIDYGTDVYNNRSIISLYGLQENLAQGVQLLEHYLRHAQVDEQAYQNFVDDILKARNNRKHSKSAILDALSTYSKYGRNSRLRDVLSEQELKAIQPQQLVQIIHDFFDYNHAVFYYGNDLAATKQILLAQHQFGNDKAIAPAKAYPPVASSKQVYFVPHDMVQTEIIFNNRNGLFDPKLLTSSYLFNEYFGNGLSSITYQEIREARSLAYSAFSSFSNASKKDEYNYVKAYIGTQTNKLPQATAAMLELLNDMPKNENQFNNTRKSILKTIATSRYTKDAIFYRWLVLKDLGLDYDINRKLYTELQNFSLDDLTDFFEREIKHRNFNVGLIGKKEDLSWPAIEQLGTLHELSKQELFGY